MKKLLLRLSVFCILMATLLWAITAYTDQKLRNRSKGRMMAWYNVAHGVTGADILVMGNSHARVQVDPQVLADRFPGSGVYNLGLDGYAFDLQLARYRFYRRFNRAPRLILLCVDYNNFNRSHWRIDKEQFLPYLDDTALANALKETDFDQWRADVPFLKYRGEGNAVRAAMTDASPLQSDDSGFRTHAGYEARDYYWNEEQFRTDKRYLDRILPHVDSTVWYSFLAFAQECHASDITIVAVFTPYFTRFVTRVDHPQEYRQWLRHTLPASVPLIDFSEVSFASDTAFFYNGSHMNKRGAEVFSAALADSLVKKGLYLQHH